jgi:hypothetical protein
MDKDHNKSNSFFNWLHKPESEIYKKTNYTKHILLTGLLKSTTETALIGGGIAGILIYWSNPTVYNDNYFFVSLLSVLAGIIVDLYGDKIKMEHHDQELKATEKLMEDKAKDIAQKLVEHEMKELEDAICNDNPDTLCNKHKK